MSENDSIYQQAQDKAQSALQQPVAGFSHMYQEITAPPPRLCQL